MSCPPDAFIHVCWTFFFSAHKRGKTGECVMWLTDWVSWALVQHMKNFSLLLQLLAWPSSSRCLRKRKWRMKPFERKRKRASWEASASKYRSSQKYLSVYVVRLRWRRRVAFSLTKVRPVGSNVHIRVMHTLSMTSQLHTTIPAMNVHTLYQNRTRWSLTWFCISLTQSQVFGSDIRARLVILHQPGDSNHGVHQLHQEDGCNRKRDGEGERSRDQCARSMETVFWPLNNLTSGGSC